MNLHQLNQGWLWIRLEDIADITSGLAKGKRRKSSDKLTEIPYLRVANVQRGYLSLEEIRLIAATEDEIQKLLLKEGDILFTEGGDRDKLGRGWIWSNEIPECIHQNHVFRARLYTDQISSKLISLYSNSHGQTYFLGAGKQTTNLASINLTKLSSLPIPLPPVNEQRRIVDKIEVLTAHSKRAREALEDIPALIEQFKQSVLAAAFRGDLTADWHEKNPHIEPVNILVERMKSEARIKSITIKDDLPIPSTIPKGWEWMNLADICLVITDGDHQSIPKTGTGVPVVDIRNISSGELSFEKVRYASPEYFNTVPKYKIPTKNDILYSVVGTYGIAVIVNTNAKFCLQRNTALIKPCKSINVNFLMYALRSIIVKIQIDKIATGTTQKLITLSNLSRIKIPVAPLDVQQQIVEKIEDLFSNSSNLEAALGEMYKRLKLLDQSILSKAFCGELVPQDPNDEPASVLLERIRAERKKLTPKKKTKRPRKQKTTQQLTLEDL